MGKLQLSLKKQWFDMTKSGVKKEEYREITEYWAKRLVWLHKDDMSYCNFVSYLLSPKLNQYYADNFSFKSFDTNKMTLGYPKSTDKSRIVELENLGIEIREGNTEWGAEKGKLYFVIKHGKILNE